MVDVSKKGPAGAPARTGGRVRRASLQRAKALLARIPLVDGHNDLPWVIRNDAVARGDVAAFGLEKRRNSGDTDIPRLREGGVAAQWWAAFMPARIDKPGRAILEQIDLIHRMHALHADVFLPATKAADIARAKRLGKIASFIAIEGGVGLDNSIEVLRIWHRLGARLMTLCHNETLDWVDSATDAPRSGGLSPFGRLVVGELNRLGMLVDLAHVAPSVMRQVLDVSRAPVVFSHSNALALCSHPRNVPDDVLDRMRANGGLIMATFVPKFLVEPRRDWERALEDPRGAFDFRTPLGEQTQAHAARTGAMPRATVQDVADHICYVADRAGIAHVGIGSDFFGGPTVDGLEHVGCYPVLLAELIERGWSDAALAGLMSGNFIRVFRAVERVGRGLSADAHSPIGRADAMPATTEG